MEREEPPAIARAETAAAAIGERKKSSKNLSLMARDCGGRILLTEIHPSYSQEVENESRNPPPPTSLAAAVMVKGI